MSSLLRKIIRDGVIEYSRMQCSTGYVSLMQWALVVEEARLEVEPNRK